MELPWFLEQIEQKLGFTPFLGTLNLRLTAESLAERSVLDNAEELLVEPQAGYFPGVLFRASIEGLECAVVVPVMPNYPRDVLEIIAPVNLRRRLGLVDGGVVAVSVRV